MVKSFTMNVITLDTSAGSSIPYSVSTAGLEVGPEIDWDPDHITISAWLEHVPFAFWLTKVLRPRCIVELGTERGVSYSAFCQAVDRLGIGARCFAVDTWRGDEHAGHYDESVFSTVVELNDKRYRRFSQLLRTTFAEARPYFADGEVDLLHIDGLHTYDAVAEDFRTWRSTLSNRGVVVFHDTNVRRDDFGVWRLWRELSGEFPHFEFVHGYGLGIIGVGDDLPPALRTLFEVGAQDEQRRAVRGLFSARGLAVLRAFDLQAAQQQAVDADQRKQLSDQQVLAANQQVQAANEQVQAASQQVLAAGQQAEGVSAALAALQHEADELRNEVITLREQAEAAQAIATESQAAVASGQGTISMLRERLAAEERTVKSLREQLDTSAVEIAELSRRFIDQAANVQEEIARQSAREAEAAKRSAQVEAELRALLAHSEARCAAFVSSTSWRVTAPLRAVKIAAGGGKQPGQTNVDEAEASPPPDDLLPEEPSTEPAVAETAVRERIMPPAYHVGLLHLRVLLVAELSLQQCRKYRVDQKREMIERLGWDCTVVSWHDADKAIILMQTHSVVIFYRVPAFADALRMTKEAKSLGLPMYFELDDLIFDLNDYAANPNLIGLDPTTTKGLLDGALLYRHTLKECGDIIASTPYLAKRMQAVGGRSMTIIENALDNETIQIAAAHCRRTPDGKIRIIYGSGTRTHDADFALIGKALSRILTENQNVELVVVGELNLPASLLQADTQVQRLPTCVYAEYLSLVGSSDIAVAPLIANNFNDAKSSIKFLEAASMGVPSVCSPRSAFTQSIRHGETGFLAESTEEWYAALSSLIKDPALRERVGENARRDVLQSYSPDAIARRQVQPLLARHQPLKDPSLHVLEVNILHSPQTFGGATVVMEEMARRLNQRADTRVSLFTSAPAGWVEPYAIERGHVDGMPIFRMGIQDRPGWMEETWDETAAEGFRDVVRVLRPDVVHFHAVQGIGAALLQVCHEEGIRFVVTLHDAWWVCERQFLVTGEGKYCGQLTIDMNICRTCVPNMGYTVLRNLRLRQGLEWADLLLAPSEHWRRFYLANGFAADRVRVNGNGIPLPETAKPNQGPPRLRFGFVAGSERVKGFPLLKRTFEALERDDWELVLVNHGLSMNVDSYDGITWNARGNIKIVPPFKEAQRDAFYDTIDVLLFPSQWPESFGLTVREALARNKWVISTNQGGAAEAVTTGVNGTLIPISDDIQPFRKAIENLLDRKPDLEGWVNPASDRVRGFAAQAEELHEILAAVASGSADVKQADAA